MSEYDALIVGGGQAGLAAAWALRERGIRPALLEAGDEPVGSWPRYYDSLVLFSSARYCALPGMPFPGDPHRFPHRDELIGYLRRYASSLDAEIHTGSRVVRVCAENGGYTAHTGEGMAWHAPIVLAATGNFGRPHRPDIPALRNYAGRVLHAAEYREPGSFAGQRVVVVGAGNSAVQIGVELAAHARVTLASRKPPAYVPQCPLGRDLHFWASVTGLERLPTGRWLTEREFTAPVVDDGRYQRAIEAGCPDRRVMFTAAHGTEVTWPNGVSERVDAVILATGYRPDLGYLHALPGALDESGRARHIRGISRVHRGLGFVGIEGQRSIASGALRGVGRDARYVVSRLLRQEPPMRTGRGAGAVSGEQRVR